MPVVLLRTCVAELVSRFKVDFFIDTVMRILEADSEPTLETPSSVISRFVDLERLCLKDISPGESGFLAVSREGAGILREGGGAVLLLVWLCKYTDCRPSRLRSILGGPTRPYLIEEASVA